MNTVYQTPLIEDDDNLKVNPVHQVSIKQAKLKPSLVSGIRNQDVQATAKGGRTSLSKNLQRQ